MVLAMRHGTVPRTLHIDEPSPHVDWSSGAVELLREARRWPDVDRPRRAAVSSFGVSGTNAHVIVEAVEPPEVEADVEARSGVVTWVPWVLSARDGVALRAQAARLAAYVRSSPALEPACGRLVAGDDRGRACEHRAVVVGADRDGAVERPGRGGRGGGLRCGWWGRARSVFVFPGQGSQWAGMAVELLESSPVFADAVAGVWCGVGAVDRGWSVRR